MNIDHWLTSIPPLAVYLVAGIVVGLESIGIPLPGEVVLVAAAVMSSRHELAVSPHGVAAAAVIGAVVGDSIGYAVGRRFGDRLWRRLERRYPAHINYDLIDYASHVYARYGMLAVFFGRFIALLRIFSGPLSGSLHMAYGKFLVANVTGAIAWSAGTTYLVYYLGTAAESWLKGFSFVGLGIALILGVTASTLLRKRLQRNVREHAAKRRALENA